MYAYIPHELEIIRTLLSYRVELFNPFFVFLNNLDSGVFYWLVGLFCFTCIKPRLGIRCFLVMGLIVATNYFFKHLFLQPRPVILDPSLGLIKVYSPYGLPSGGAQGAVTLATFFIHYYKEHWVKICAISYAVLICISRIYLGMHFISDVLLGAFLGFIITKICLVYIEPLFNKLQTVRPWLAYSILAPILAMLIVFEVPNSYYWGVCLFAGAWLCEIWLRPWLALPYQPRIAVKGLFFIGSYGLFLGLYYLKDIIPYAKFAAILILFHVLILAIWFIQRKQTKAC